MRVGGKKERSMDNRQTRQHGIDSQIPPGWPPEIGEGQGDRLFVTALARGLEILRAFRAGDGVLGNHEIAQRTGLPRSTVTRLTYTLTKLGYLSHSKRFDKYRLGVGVLSFGYALLNDLHIRRVAKPFMDQLADYGKANVGLAVPDRLEMLYIDASRGADNVTHRLDAGSKIPMATTAMGRAFLASIEGVERAYLLDRLRHEHGADWPQIAAEINRAVDDVARWGYCVAEWQPDIIAIGVPMRRRQGQNAYVFNCGGPKYMIGRDRLEQDFAPRLLSLVRQVERALPDPDE
jgi:DNA-binding IclR family transcriptional regulator